MPAECVSAIQARVARLVRLDVCGNPVTGDGSAVVVTNGFISIAPSPQYLDGEEHQQRRADGALCLYQKDPSELTRVDLGITWCVLDPDALVVISGERLLMNTAPTGSGVAFGEGQLLARFSLEVWQPVVGAGGCDPSGQQRFLYWAFPNVGNSKFNDFTFENAPLQFSSTSETKAVGFAWGDGPTGGPWAPPFEPNEHFLFNVTTVPPPSPTCGAVLL